MYGKGLWDLAFVTFYTLVFTCIRELSMGEVLRPFARRMGLSRGKQSRLTEQIYTAAYFGTSGLFGLYVMKRTLIWYFDNSAMFADYPPVHDGPFKFYYLVQSAYWLQQILVLAMGLEKPRKDYNELVTHHLLTVALIAGSYCFHLTYAGLAVFVTHDISDFFLAVSHLVFKSN